MVGDFSDGEVDDAQPIANGRYRRAVDSFRRRCSLVSVPATIAGGAGEGEGAGAVAASMGWVSRDGSKELRGDVIALQRAMGLVDASATSAAGSWGPY